MPERATACDRGKANPQEQVSICTREAKHMQEMRHISQTRWPRQRESLRQGRGESKHIRNREKACLRQCWEGKRDKEGG